MFFEVWSQELEKKMLSFDEFRAINNRERNKEKVKEQEVAAKKSTAKKTDPNKGNHNDKQANSPRKSLVQSLGEFLEYHSMQIFYITLLILDTFAGFLELYYLYLSVNNDSYALHLKALNSFSKFTSMIFSIEIFFVYIAFGLSTLFHVGYLTDLIILCTQMYLEYRQYGCEIKMLNIFRLWRPIRLLNAMILQEKVKHNQLQEKIDTLQETIQKHQIDYDNIKLELNKEKEAKNAVENMLLNYKEEVDTLNEALKIAAMDIADVGQNEEELFTSEDEENDEDMTASVGSKSKETLSTAERSKRSAKLEILRTALEANPILSVNESKSTFVIHEDGKFEKK